MCALEAAIRSVEVKKIKTEIHVDNIITHR